MNNYVRPVIFDNEELAEGVYATGSGKPNGNDGTCWTVWLGTIQTNAGDHSDNEIWARHSKEVAHLSYELTVTCDIIKVRADEKITSIEPEGFGTFKVDYIDGSTTFTVTRTLGANQSFSGDDVSFKVKIYTDGSHPGPNAEHAYVSKVYLPKCGFRANNLGQGGDGT